MCWIFDEALPIWLPIRFPLKKLCTPYEKSSKYAWEPRNGDKCFLFQKKALSFFHKRKRLLFQNMIANSLYLRSVFASIEWECLWSYSVALFSMPSSKDDGMSSIQDVSLHFMFKFKPFHKCFLSQNVNVKLSPLNCHCNRPFALLGHVINFR